MADAPFTVQARALRRAADILGGKHTLRAALHVPMARLEEWLEGRADPPMDIFLRAVDIISTPAAPSRPAAASVRARTLVQQSGELMRNTERTLARSRELRNQSRAAPHPNVARFLGTVFGKNDRAPMLAAALDAAIDATHAQMGNVQLRSQGGLEIVTYRGFQEPFLKFFACVSDDHGAACGAALKTASRVIVGDVASDPIFAGTEAARIMEGAHARAVQSTPLVSVSGQVLGMVSTHFDQPHVPADAELAIVDQIARRTAYWLEQATE